MYYEWVAKHIGWKSLATTIYHTQFDCVLATDDPTSTVIHAAQPTIVHDASAAEKLDKEFRSKSCLNGYKPLFCLSASNNVQRLFSLS